MRGANSDRKFNSSNLNLPRHQRRSSFAQASFVKSLSIYFVFLALASWLTGCQTGNISNVNQSYIAVRKTVISNLPQGLRKESENGRELYSGYFEPKNWEEDATDANERAYAMATILNDSRPYEVDIHVFRQKKTKRGTYTNEGEDSKLTKALVLRLRDGLADRHEDRNIIDDFRAF